MPRVVVVTDSTASLPAELAQARGIVVVPLQVVIGAQVLDEGPDGATPEVVAQALRDFVPVSTSRPAPALFAEVYRELAADGVDEIVSIHLSGEMSGTFESAQLAALEVDAAGARRRLRPGRHRDRLCRTVGGRRARRRRHRPGGGRGGAGPRRGGHLAVLRRHPRVPPPRRPDRCRCRDPRRRAVGQAAARDRRRQGGRRANGSVRRRVRWPGSRTSRSRRPATAGRRLRRPPRQRRPGRASWRRRWPSGWPTGSRAARSGAASSVPCSAPTSGRAWSRSASPRALTRHLRTPCRIRAIRPHVLRCPAVHRSRSPLSAGSCRS